MRDSVSSRPPSNRACDFPAHGSPTSFTGGVRPGPPPPDGPGSDDGSGEGDQPEAIWCLVGHQPPSPGPAAFVALGHKQGGPGHGECADLVELAGRVAVTEIPGPAAQEAVDFSHDLIDWHQQPGPCRELTDPVPGVLGRLA